MQCALWQGTQNFTRAASEIQDDPLRGDVNNHQTPRHDVEYVYVRNFRQLLFCWKLGMDLVLKVHCHGFLLIDQTGDEGSCAVAVKLLCYMSAMMTAQLLLAINGPLEEAVYVCVCIRRTVPD